MPLHQGDQPGALFSEREGVIRASFRSKGNFKVDILHGIISMAAA